MMPIMPAPTRYHWLTCCRDQVAAVEAVHRVLVLAALDDEHARDRRQQAEGARQQREQDAAHAEDGIQRDAQDHGADVLGRRRLEQVGSAAGAVADVVAHEVRDDGRVARVVLGDAGLHLAHEVGADVRRLRVDAAAELREQGHEAGAEAEADDLQRDVLVVRHAAEEHEQAADAQQAHGHDRQPRHRPAADGDLQRLVEARHGRRRRAQVGADGHEHADVAGDRRAGRARDERERDLPGGALAHLRDVRHVAIQEVEREDGGRRDPGQHEDGLVLAGQERLGALADRGGDLLHLRLAGVGRQDLPRENPGHSQRQHADAENDPQYGFDAHDSSSSYVCLGLSGRPGNGPSAGRGNGFMRAASQDGPVGPRKTGRGYAKTSREASETRMADRPVGRGQRLPEPAGRRRTATSRKRSSTTFSST
jgi:hypothetical protein